MAASDIPKKRKRAIGECSHPVRPIASAKFRLEKHGDSKSIVASKFMSIVPDHLLLEILLRLPNARSVLRSATVCKHWSSLLLSPEFSFHQRFIEYHHLQWPSFDSSYPPDRTFAFLFTFSNSDLLYCLHSDPKPNPKPYDLSFIPKCARLRIRASSGDLMLLSEGFRRYYICNSLTKQWFRLPDVPRKGVFALSFGPFNGAPGFALVPCPSNTNQQLLGKYRVVLLCWTRFAPNLFCSSVAVFDSETRLWTHSYPSVPYPYPYPMESNFSTIRPDLEIASNGVLYWLEGAWQNYHVMASLDPATAELRLIPLPAGQFQGIRNNTNRHIVRSGVVRGRVRVSRMVESQSVDRFVLRIWELDCGDDTWKLVHDVELEASGASLFFVLAFDPNDGDAVFVVRECGIFRYEITRQKFVKLCRFVTIDGFSMQMLKKEICEYLKVFTLVHPLWPTSIPAL